MFRRPTYRSKGAPTLRSARELVAAFIAPTERSPWKGRLVASSSSTGSPNGPAIRAQSVSEVGVSVPEKSGAERVHVPCFVLFAPGPPSPRAERSVSNEGNPTRFGFDSRDDPATKVA